MSRIVVVGGVAAGMSAASQAKRRQPEAEVVVLERGPYVSYAACGMPYNIEDPARTMDDLVVLTPADVRERDIDLRLRHRALAVDPSRGTVTVQDLGGGGTVDLAYDALVLATGAAPILPPIAGLDQPGIFLLRELTDGQALKRHLAETRPARAVIVGAGYIGMEMAEALRRRGVAVTVLERMEQVVPGFDPAIASLVVDALQRHGVTVDTGVTVESVEEGDNAGDARLTVRTDRGLVPTDMVLVSVGVRPRVELARSAGVALGETGAIAVDEEMHTSVPGVFAAGDCAEARHIVSGRPVWIPLGTTANKQGKVAGANAAGAAERFPGVAGTAAFRIFDLEVGRTGLSPTEAARVGLEAVAAVSRQPSHAHSVPGASPITTILSVDRKTGRLLGAEMAGVGVVAKRIDVLATALHAGLTVEALVELDLSYAPPFAPVYDPVLIAAAVAQKRLHAVRRQEAAASGRAAR
ncbi:MAG: FAD-dependent oxidoreductase [Acidobacteriota bacterium]|jgi:NADPH-dependent 2,4-dienoyl-CoA reductase/sulfur reductase-like enzyme